MGGVKPAAEALGPWVNDVTETITDEFEKQTSLLATAYYSAAEIALVCDTLRLVRPDFICEWGTHVGHSAKLFHDAALLMDVDCVIHSVEISEQVQGGRGSAIGNRYVSLHVGDGPTVGLALYEDSGCVAPLFFLDDSHVYEDVLSQLERIAYETPHAAMLVHDVFKVDVLGNLMLHEPGLAVRDFTRRDRYTITSVQPRGAMMRLLPR